MSIYEPIYDWKVGAVPPPVPAQVVGERIAELERIKGRIVPENLVDDARPEGSPLHPCFEWNDAEAAEKYRHAQATKILCAVVTKLPQQRAEARMVRAFVHVVSGEEKHFVSTAVAMRDKDFRRQVVERAYRELLAWKARYEEFEELGEIFSVIDGLSDNFDMPVSVRNLAGMAGRGEAEIAKAQ